MFWFNTFWYVLILFEIILSRWWFCFFAVLSVSSPQSSRFGSCKCASSSPWTVCNWSTRCGQGRKVSKSSRIGQGFQSLKTQKISLKTQKLTEFPELSLQVEICKSWLYFRGLWGKCLEGEGKQTNTLVIAYQWGQHPIISNSFENKPSEVAPLHGYQLRVWCHLMSDVSVSVECSPRNKISTHLPLAARDIKVNASRIRSCEQPKGMQTVDEDFVGCGWCRNTQQIPCQALAGLLWQQGTTFSPSSSLAYLSKSHTKCHDKA